MNTSYRFFARVADSPEISDQENWARGSMRAFIEMNVPKPIISTGRDYLGISFDVECAEQAIPEDLLDTALEFFKTASQLGGMAVPTLTCILAIPTEVVQWELPDEEKVLFTTDLTDLYLQRQLSE
jgi:hypothetical protein